MNDLYLFKHDRQPSNTSGLPFKLLNEKLITVKYNTENYTSFTYSTLQTLLPIQTAPIPKQRNKNTYFTSGIPPATQS